MNIADFILIAFLLLMLLIGISKGFVKMAISFLSGIVAFIVAFIFSKPIAGLLDSMAIFDGAKLRIENFFSDRFDTTAESVESTIISMEYPEFVKEFLLDKFSDSSQTLDAGLKTLSENIFNLLLVALSFIILLVSIRIALFFLEKIIQGSFSKIKVLNVTNKLLGAAFSTLQATLIVYVVLGIIALISSRMPDLTETISESLIVSKIYYNNFMVGIFF